MANERSEFAQNNGGRGRRLSRDCHASGDVPPRDDVEKVDQYGGKFKFVSVERSCNSHNILGEYSYIN